MLPAGKDACSQAWGNYYLIVRYVHCCTRTTKGLFLELVVVFRSLVTVKEMAFEVLCGDSV